MADLIKKQIEHYCWACHMMQLMEWIGTTIPKEKQLYKCPNCKTVICFDDSEVSNG